jgi:hypothetical protein
VPVSRIGRMTGAHLIGDCNATSFVLLRLVDRALPSYFMLALTPCNPAPKRHGQS